MRKRQHLDENVKTRLKTKTKTELEKIALDHDLTISDVIRRMVEKLIKGEITI